MVEPGSARLPKIGDVVDGKYALDRLLGQGGMGAVYAARHLKLGHAVAVKVMLADAANHEAAARFVNEGRAAANIQNEHVVRVSDVDEENGYAYMILELLEGEDLSQVLTREGRLAPHVAVGYVLQALDGVKHAHAQGIVHRDLKPSNLFLARRRDGSVVVKVLDFGISKASGASILGKPDALTSTKAMLGSPLYMSPEQLRSSKNVDARADIWAIGVILYELVTGQLPFMGDNLGELFSQILETEAPLLTRLAPEASPALEAIVARCLQRRPDQRFASVIDLERELAPLGTPSQVFGTIAMGPPMGRPGPAQAPSGSVPSFGMTPAPWTHGSGPMRISDPNAPAVAVPGVGVSTGSPVGGAIPPGTPQPNAFHRQTDSAWQRTASSSKGPKTVLVVALAVLGVGGVASGFAYLSWRGRHPSSHVTAEVAPASSTPAIPAPPIGGGGAPPMPASTTVAAGGAGAVVATTTAVPNTTSAPASRDAGVADSPRTGTSNHAATGNAASHPRTAAPVAAPAAPTPKADAPRSATATSPASPVQQSR